MRFTAFFACGRRSTFVARVSTTRALAVAKAYANKRGLELVSVHFH